MHTVIETHQLTKTYHIGEIPVYAIRGVDLKITEGEMVAIMGSSGSGKSTLMNLLGCLDQPTSGEYFLGGVNVNSLNKNQYADIRNNKIGFVFQTYNLLPRTTALENVELPLFYDRDGRIKNAKQAAVEALARVGLADRMNHEPTQLSGGQQQRVAIARALVNQPAIILADEPTGNLDTRTSLDILSLFQELNEQGITIVMVTHELDIAGYAQRIIGIRDGRIRNDRVIAKRQNAKSDLENLADINEEVA